MVAADGGVEPFRILVLDREDAEAGEPARAERPIGLDGHRVVGLDPKDFVKYDPRYLRPTEVDLLIGDASKARKVLGWRPNAWQRTWASLDQSSSRGILSWGMTV